MDSKNFLASPKKERGDSGSLCEIRRVEMAKSDRVTSLIFLILSLGICIESIRLSPGRLAHPGAGFFPLLAGGIIGVFSIVLFLRSFGGSIKEKSEKRFWEEGADSKGVLLTVSALIIYSLVFEILGFLLSSIIFFIILIQGITHKGWIRAIFIGMLSSVGGYLIFQIWLKTQLPRGIFG